MRFGKNLGGGDADQRVFQFDASFPRYRAGKLNARGERLGKYFQVHDLNPAVEDAVNSFIVNRLVAEQSGGFTFDDDALCCALTGERLSFGDGMQLRRAEAPSAVRPPYVSGFDALASQVQEDLAIVSGDSSRHWLSAVHLSFPNHWAAEDKIGKAFPAIHEPVAGMEAMNGRVDELVRVMFAATDGLVRFAWGITWEDELNHHPQPPPGQVRKKAVDPQNPRAFLRVERQTVWGFKAVRAALFTIRTYLYDVADLRKGPERRRDLAAAVASMSTASLAYKGLACSRDALLQWLSSASP